MDSNISTTIIFNLKKEKQKSSTFWNEGPNSFFDQLSQNFYKCERYDSDLLVVKSLEHISKVVDIDSYIIVGNLSKTVIKRLDLIHPFFLNKIVLIIPDPSYLTLEAKTQIVNKYNVLKNTKTNVIWQWKKINNKFIDFLLSNLSEMM